VTLHDVARLAGVEPISVSRALNTPGQVSKELLRKVTDAVAKKFCSKVRRTLVLLEFPLPVSLLI
jgi:hypothetical protein